MNVQSNGMGSDQGDLIAQINALKAENDKLKAKAAARSTLSFKVSEKGAVSIYGMGRFPVTLYASQYDRLVKQWDDLAVFVKDNRHLLTTKD